MIAINKIDLGNKVEKCNQAIHTSFDDLTNAIMEVANLSFSVRSRTELKINQLIGPMERPSNVDTLKNVPATIKDALYQQLEIIALNLKDIDQEIERL